MEPGRLIPTSSKHKLPRGLSHPVGAEAISRALAGVPQFDSLRTHFGQHAHPVSVLAPPELHQFLSVFSVHGWHWPIVGANRSPGWDWYLSVPAIPSEARAAVRGLLLSVGLPEVRRWLPRPRPPTWYEVRRVFEVGCSPETAEVCFVETVNRRLVAASVRTRDREVPGQAGG